MYSMCLSIASGLTKDEEPPIRVLQRALVLGDAIWIAINRADKREVVLDSIVERKRLDDLCASVKDKRFDEQKARLRRSGLRDPVYLVEAYNTQSNLESNGRMIYTSKLEVMLLNDFQLESTPDWKASVEFLMRRTEVLRDLHKTIDLSLIPDEEIHRSNYVERLNELRRQQPERYWVTTYENFEDLNHKSSNLTIKELWARMISCLPGMSAEKITSFVDRWNTPIDFWNDVRSHQFQEFAMDSNPWDWIERKSTCGIHRNLGDTNSGRNSSMSTTSDNTSISGLATSNDSYSAGSTRSCIGPGLCKKIWELYDLSDYETS